jgi:hypothetical protein
VLILQAFQMRKALRAQGQRDLARYQTQKEPSCRVNDPSAEARGLGDLPKDPSLSSPSS